MKNNNYLRKVLCIMAAVATVAMVLCVPLKTYADGTITVSARKDGVSTYKVYLIASGTFKEGFLWNICMDEDFNSDFWKKLGYLGDGRADNIIDWLETQIKGDVGDNFVLKIAGLVDTFNYTPDYRMKSGESVTLNDGYYLVTCNDSHPVLLLVGGGQERTIYEKPLEGPQTGDRTDIWLYAILGAVSAVALLAAIASSWESRDNDEK